MILPHLETRLRQYADAVVNRVCQRQLGKMIHPPRIETDFVASLVENGAPLLERVWRRVLGRSAQIHVAGVFTHQSPYVQIQGSSPYPVPTKQCELADLLVLHSHRVARGKVFRRGVLMQTKIDKGKLFSPDEPQFWLYDRWPGFIVRSPGFDRSVRDFGGDRRSGSYGLVSTGGWLVTPPVKPMSATLPGAVGLGSFLVDMLYDMDPAQPGRMSAAGRQVYHNEKKDWSRTVMDLLQITGARTLKLMGKKHGLYGGPMPRAGGSLALMRADQLDGGGSTDGGQGVIFGEDGGFGAIIIETQAAD